MGSEADIEGNFWQAVAALNPSKRTANESLGFLEVEAEIVNGTFVRQFDGKWIVPNDEGYDILQDIPEKHRNLMTLQGDGTNNLWIRKLFKIGPEARNLEFGIFGVPDSEVFSDNVDHLKVDTTWYDEINPAYDFYWTQGDSSARPCHSVIDSSPYRIMSHNDESFCQAASSYKTRCMNYGAVITMPMAC